MIYAGVAGGVIGVIVLFALLWFNLYQSQQALAQKAQEAQVLSQAILTSQPTGEANLPPTFAALRATAAAVGTSAAAVTCQGGPSIRFVSSQSTIAPGGSVYLQWSDALRVSDVIIEPGLGKVDLEGSRLVEPAETTKYTLTAEGCGGKTSQTVTIQVVTPSLTAVPTNLQPTATSVPPSPTVAPTNTSILPTRVRATPTTAATPTESVAPGVYVTDLRIDPTNPRSGDQMTFYATFLNTLGVQENNFCVEIFKGEDVSKSVGISTCGPIRLETGTTELSSTGWNVREGACTQYLARAISEDAAKARTPYLQPDGEIKYLNFTVCP